MAHCRAYSEEREIRNKLSDPLALYCTINNKYKTSKGTTLIILSKISYMFHQQNNYSESSNQNYVVTYSRWVEIKLGSCSAFVGIAKQYFGTGSLLQYSTVLAILRHKTFTSFMGMTHWAQIAILRHKTFTSFMDMTHWAQIALFQ